MTDRGRREYGDSESFGEGAPSRGSSGVGERDVDRALSESGEDCEPDSDSVCQSDMVWSTYAEQQARSKYTREERAGSGRGGGPESGPAAEQEGSEEEEGTPGPSDLTRGPPAQFADLENPNSNHREQQPRAAGRGFGRGQAILAHSLSLQLHAQPHRLLTSYSSLPTLADTREAGQTAEEKRREQKDRDVAETRRVV